MKDECIAQGGDPLRPWISVLLVAVALMGSALQVEAQGATEHAWSPIRNSLTLGVHAYATDGTSARRVGVGWYLSTQLRTTVMARSWDAHDQVEVEGRWIRASDRTVRPFATASLLWQERFTRTSVGGTVGGGVELYLMAPFVWDIGLGWQSLFDVSGANDHHWFRVNLGLAVVPIPWPPRRQEE